MIITRVRNGPVCAGTIFSLFAEITFNESSEVDVNLMKFVTKWRKDNGPLLKNNSRINLWNDSTSGSHISYLNYLPINTTDSGRYTVTVTISAVNKTLNMYMYPVTTSASHNLNVTGKLILLCDIFSYTLFQIFQSLTFP